jgi:hypothetical protein
MFFHEAGLVSGLAGARRKLTVIHPRVRMPLVAANSAGASPHAAGNGGWIGYGVER